MFTNLVKYFSFLLFLKLIYSLAISCMYIIHSGHTQPPSLTPANLHKLSPPTKSPSHFHIFLFLLHNPLGLATNTPIGTAVKLSTAA